MPLSLIKELAQGQAYNADAEAPERWLWKGLRVKAIDDSTLTADDTKENQAVYPQHGKQKEGLGSPLIRVVVLQSLFTGLIEECEFGPYKGKCTGEMSLSQPILRKVKEGDLFVGDRYYPTFFFIAQLILKNGHGLFQAHSVRSVDFRQGIKLGESDHIVEWKKPQRPSYMTKEECERFPESINVRECSVKAGKQNLTFVTTLLDHKNFTSNELSELYKKRWKIEFALRDLKSNLDLEHISAKTPEMIAKEIWCHLLTYNYVRWFMANTAIVGKGEIWEVSFSLTLYLMLANHANFLTTESEDEVKHLRGSIYIQLIKNPVLDRPGRKEPRAIKKRPKPQKGLKEPRQKWHADRTP